MEVYPVFQKDVFHVPFRTSGRISKSNFLKNFHITSDNMEASDLPYPGGWPQHAFDQIMKRVSRRSVGKVLAKDGHTESLLALNP